MEEVTHYNKFLVAAVAAGVSLLTYFSVDSEIVQIVVTALGAVGVYAVPNKP